MFIRHHHRDSYQRGQILLITVMLLAAAVTVIMTIAFNSTTETQVTKMEEDSQTALSAAETALEAAIQKKGTLSVALSDPAFNNMFSGSGITGEATVVEVGGKEFVTPLLQRDEQYTFYLSTYAPGGVLSNYWPNGNLVIYLESEKGSGLCNNPKSTDVALELTFVNAADTGVPDDSYSRYLIDPCGLVPGDGSNTHVFIPVNSTESIQGTKFAYNTAPAQPELNSISKKKMVILRVLNAPTRIGFKSTVSMPAQGRVITSQAKTATGVMKKIQLFQSYPQIPSDFFITSF